MDPGDFIYAIIFIIWFLSQIATALKKNKQKAEPTQTPQDLPPPRPRPERRRPKPVPASSLLEQLEKIEAETQQTLPELDEKVREQVSFIAEHEIRTEAERLRSILRDDTSPDAGAAARDAHALLGFQRDLLRTARIHTSLRRRRELEGPRQVADRLVAEFAEGRPHTVAPPVAIVWDLSANDKLAASPLASSTLFVPRSVLQDPSHWALVADPVARYINEEAPTLYQEIYDRLELGVDEAQIGADTEALTKVLFASWIHRIFADAVGALLFGPTYLRAVATLYAQPRAPARVTSIHMNTDGSVHAEPPAHVRVHLTAQWVTRMGYPSEAADVRREWDERHGSPQALGFWGAMTSLPAAPVLDAARDLVDTLYELPLEAIGGSPIASAHGLSDWQSHAREAADAAPALAGGERARGSARSVIAGAIDAALRSPEAATRIHTALYDSLVGLPATRKLKKVAGAPPAEPMKPTRGALTGREVAEALILGEILLEPRSR